MKLYLFLIITPFIILSCSCTPETPVAELRMTPHSELTVKGFDLDCDGDIDYWQHYNSFGREVGRKIWVKHRYSE